MRWTQVLLLAGSCFGAVGCVEDFDGLFAAAGPSGDASMPEDGALPQSSGDDPDRHRDGGSRDAAHASTDADRSDGLASGNDGEVDAQGRDAVAGLDAEVDARLPGD
jgi:hypothetical protein